MFLYQATDQRNSDPAAPYQRLFAERRPSPGGWDGFVRVALAPLWLDAYDAATPWATQVLGSRRAPCVHGPILDDFGRFWQEETDPEWRRELVGQLVERVWIETSASLTDVEVGKAARHTAGLPTDPRGPCLYLSPHAGGI